jgi:hypothetical protein
MEQKIFIFFNFLNFLINLIENFTLIAEMKTKISEMHWISVISVGAEFFPKLKFETMNDGSLRAYEWSN